MSLRELHQVIGVACDVRGCEIEHSIGKPQPVFSQAVRDFEAALLRLGWVRRYVRSTRWYCPDHAHLGVRCSPGCSGEARPYSRCPNHGGGRVLTVADVIAGRFP